MPTQPPLREGTPMSQNNARTVTAAANSAGILNILVQALSIPLKKVLSKD